ncbi:RNA-directed DNA polymerase from mobile element jockey, partial [Nephila pilipes]
DLCLFADDTALLSQHRDTVQARENLQSYLQVLQKWLTRWRIAINTEKSAAIIFKNISLRRYPNNLRLFHNNIPWKTSTTYLGITLDKTLHYITHIKNSCAKFKKKLLYQIPILRRRSKLPLHLKRLVYLQYLQPLLTYGCAIWGSTYPTHIKKLQLLQNRALRIITTAPVFIPRRVLHDELQVESIPHTLRKLSSSFYNSLQNHHNPTINCLARPIHINSRRNYPNMAQFADNIF